MKEVDGVTTSAPYIFSQGMLTHSKSVSGALIRGVLPVQEETVSRIFQNLRVGSFEHLQSGRWGVVLGSELAYKLGVELGDQVTLIVPHGRISIAGVLPRLKRFTVAAIFNLGMYEYDSTLALIHIDDAAKLFRTEGRVSGLRVVVEDVYRAPLVRSRIAQKLGDDFFGERLDS